VSEERFMLDTSALLTLIEDEAGADRVEQLITSGRGLVTWVALLEVHYITQQERGAAEADRRYALLRQLPLTVLWEAGEFTLLTAARFKATQRLSLADAIIAAFALRQGATLIHKDPEFEALASEVPQEALPYKN